MGRKGLLFLQARPVVIPIALAVLRLKVIGSPIQTRQITCRAANGSAAEANQWNNLMKNNKSCGCGHEGKENGNGKNGKKGKGYVEIEIKMGRMPKKKAKRK